MKRQDDLKTRAKQYWYEHYLSYNGPTPKPWEIMAEFVELEKVKTKEEKK